MASSASKEAIVNLKPVVCGLGALCVLASVAGAEVRWSEESYAQVLQRAKQENKYVFIDFYATWCGPCKRLDEVTYPDAKASELLNSMIPVKWDAEKEPWIALAKQYKVSAYPTLIVIAPDGKEVDRHLGFLEAPEFVATIDGYRHGVGTIADLQNQLRAKPDDIDLLFRVGMKHADAGRAGDAAAVLAKAMELDPKNEKGRHAEMLYALGEAYYVDDRFADAKPYFERLVRDFPDSDWSNDGYKRLAATEFKLGNRDAAVSTYWKGVEKRADDAGALNGFAWFCAQRKIGLDKALPAAQKAADLSGRDPGILDTLGEVYFAMGDFDNAIKVEEEAAAKDPDDKYLKEQIEKFKKAKADADQAKK
jgi:tetratricopeptide (TPR) repeat protein